MSKLIATSQVTLMDLTERAEIRKETYYKLTSTSDAPGNLIVESKLSKGWLNATGDGTLLGPSRNEERTSDFIRVTAGSVYTFQWWSTITTGQKCWEAWQFYDSNKNPFGVRGGYGEYGSDGVQHGKRTVTAPPNACYVRLSFRSFGDGHMMFEAGAGSASFISSFDDSLKSGVYNLLRRSRGPFHPKNSRLDNYAVWENSWIDMEKGKKYILSAKGTAPFTSTHATDKEKNDICLWLVKHDENINVDRIISSSSTGNGGTKFTWNDPTGRYRLRVNTYKIDNSNYAENVLIEEGDVKNNYVRNPEDYGWSKDPLVPTQSQRYLWKFEYVYYSDGSVEVTDPVNSSIAGQNGADGPQGPQGDEGPKGDKGDTGNGIANTVVTYGLSVSDTTEPATWSSSVPTLVKGMYLWTRTVIIYTNGESTTSYQISYIAKDADATAAIDKTKQELLEKLDTVRNDSLAAAEEAKQEITAVSNDLSKAKTDLQNAVNTVDAKATNVQNDLSKAKQDLTSQAQQLQEQANAQSELTNRVSSVEETANGTKTTVSELSKTVDQNGKNITSVTARTKVVEDDLAGTKTTLSQVKMTADSTSQKTATLETGLDGLTARFENLQIGTVNLLHNSKGPFQPKGSRIDNYVTYSNAWINMEKGKEYTLSAKGTAPFTSKHATGQEKNEICLWLVKHDENINVDRIISNATTGTAGTKFTWNDPSGKYRLRVNTYKVDNSNYAEEVQIEEGNLRSTYSQNESDIESKVAEYKQTSDQNYASLQTTVQNLDGTVQANKTTAEQTAAGFKTRIESLETYKSGETTRANQYFELAKTETARQLTAERTAIAKDYVAKSTYTSDVTGLRNDLIATTTTANTTKTNLANYQASNDRAVANLQSNIQTANGNISSLQTKVEAVPGQITSAVSAVEGKIPTSAGGRNLALYTSADWSDGWTYFNGQNNQTNAIYHIYNRGFKIGDRINIRLVLKYSDIVVAEGQTARVLSQCRGNVTDWGAGQLYAGGTFYFDGSDGEIEFKGTTVVDEYIIKNEYWDWRLRVDYVASGKIQWKEAKAEVGDLPTPWSPAPEDAIEEISSLSSQIKQTADGMTLLATKTELSTAKNELQSGINTATNKANAAQNTANSNAQTISTHTTQISALNTGLSAKVSQTDFNTLSGRVTTAENNITAKANELSSKITSVEGKIPTSSGGRNLAQGTSKDWSKPFTGFSGIKNTCLNLYKVITDGLVVGDTFKTRIVLKYTDIKPASGKTAEIWIQGAGNVTAWNSGAYPSGGGGRRSLSGSGETVFELTDKINADHLKNDYWSWAFRTDWIASGSLQWKLAKVESGMFFTGWSSAPEDYDSKLASAQSEIKQTTDSIKASVSSLDKSTVKSASLTINADGIVMKAGKSTTDVANAIGSYFAVNQNAINLFSDKINVRGSMIVDGAITAEKIKAGAITADKIAANSINSSNIAASGITANVIKGGTLQSTNGSTNFELNTGKLFYNNNNTGVFRVQNGASTMGLKFSNTPVTVNGTSRILSRAILGGDRRETTLDDGKWDKGGFSGIIIETIKGVDSDQNEKADAVCVVGDTISFTHTYSNDSVSARGWRMETYSPTSSYPGNVVLKPYGLNYRQSDIIVGDVRLDNGDGSGYWMRATINTLKNCFGHILNGGVSSSALNAIRSELNKISGT